MRKLASGTNYARYAVGDPTAIALRDGFVDMPASRLRQSGNRPSEPTCRKKSTWWTAGCGCPSMHSW